MIGLAASIFHLGRPWLAYRAIIGWRRSWLSREVLCFGAFAALASLYAAIPWLEAAGGTLPAGVERALGGAVALGGLAGVGCSTMVYASTRRAFWNPAYTGLKFVLTSLVLGIPVALFVRLLAALNSPAEVLEATGLAMTQETTQATGQWLCKALMGVVAFKLLAEAAIFFWLNARTYTPLRRTALLMTGDLSRATKARFIVGALGGLALPGLLAVWQAPARVAVYPAAVLGLVVLLLALNAIGEVLERYLFFAAVVAPKMPGAPAA
jgi:DMSO reductase anchor subunit